MLSGLLQKKVKFGGKVFLTKLLSHLSHKWESHSGRQRGRVVSASDSQSDGPGFESRSGHLLDLFSVVPSSNPRSRL